MAGLSEGSPAILCRYRITANTSPLQGENAGSIPATCSIVAVTVRHDIKFGEHGPHAAISTPKESIPYVDSLFGGRDEQ